MKKIISTPYLFIFLSLFFSSAFGGWQDTMNQSWEKAKGSTMDLYNDYFSDQKSSYCINDQALSSSQNSDSKWEQLLNKLELSTKKLQQIKKAPNHSWFGEDKKSLAIEFNQLLDQTIQLLLEDSPSFSCWQKQQQLGRLKIQLQQQLTTARESLVLSTGDKKDDLEQKVADLLDNLAQLEKQKQQIKQEMRYALRSQGLNLSAEQLDMLLVRVDAKDIIKMTIIFDQVKAITRQLEKLMQTNEDNLSASKKYYAMYVVLSEMIVYIQNNYMSQLENSYLPGVQLIIDETQRIKSKTDALLKSAESHRKKVYINNIAAQQLTLKTANLYYTHLQQQLLKMENAAKISQQDLQMAKNTYETVQLSIELLNLIKTNRSNFQQLIQLQLPELVPISNIAMEKEYQRLTLKLSK